MKIAVYCLDWHMVGGSVHDLVVEPLSRHFNLRLFARDGELQSPDAQQPDADIVLWHQFPPTAEGLKTARQHIWLPMWDYVRRWGWRQWQQIPKHVRVVAFSDGVARAAREVGLTTLSLRYFKDPAAFTPVIHDGDRTAFYWNRTGLIDATFLQRFCETLEIETLLYRQLNPQQWMKTAEYTLPSMLGNTRVEVIPSLMEREAFWKQISRANVVIAPRLYEGVGMVFLEALARGCMVFAHNGATMNEYIKHRETGYLLNDTWDALRLWYSMRRGIARRGWGGEPIHRYPVKATNQNWSDIAQLDIAAIGRAARQDHINGHQRWLESIDEYVAFICSGITDV